MLSNISPLRPNPREDATSRSDRSKPQGPPRDDGFRRTMDDKRPKKDEEEFASAAEEKEETPSLFDLSKTNKSSKTPPRGKSAFKDSGKDSGSSTVTERPVTAKQGQHNDEESPDQDLGQMTSSNDRAQTKSTEQPIKLPPPQEEFYAAAETETPSPESPLPEAPSLEETPSLAPETPPTEQEASSPQIPQSQPQPHGQTQVKKPMEQAAQQPTDALKQAQAASSMQQPQKVKGAKEEGPSFESDKLGSTSKTKSSKSEEAGSKSEVKGDAAAAATAVNSSIQSSDFHVEKAPETQETARSETIRDLANQIIDRIQIMRKGDETQTTITLRHPPVLSGATITLTTTDHAKREFNISFANLTQEAKQLLDHKLREDPLTDSLERKGITVHMLTTTTQAEPNLVVDAGQASRDRQDQQQEQQEQQQRRQKFQMSEDEEVT